MFATHKEEIGVVDGVCVDCEKIYYCAIKEAAENERTSHVTECSQFIEDTKASK